MYKRERYGGETTERLSRDYRARGGGGNVPSDRAMWKHRMEQQKIMKAPRPTDLLEAILYDLSALERRWNTPVTTLQVLRSLTDCPYPEDEPPTNFVHLSLRRGAR